MGYYYVKPGKAITTSRGIVGSDDPRPEITAKCLVPKCTPSDGLPAAELAAVARLDELVKLGYLVVADEPPEPDVNAAPPPPREAPDPGASRTLRAAGDAEASPPAPDAAPAKGGGKGGAKRARG